MARTYYHDTLQARFTTFAIIVGSNIFGKTIWRMFSRVVRVFSVRSKGKLDDIIVDMIGDPVVLMSIASGTCFGLRPLDRRIGATPNSIFSGAAVERVSRAQSHKLVLNIGPVQDSTPGQIEQAIAIIKDFVGQHDSTEEDTWMAYYAFADFALNICFICYLGRGEDIGITQTRTNLENPRQSNQKGLETGFSMPTIYYLQNLQSAA